MTLPYYQRDHLHCFDQQQGHEKHLVCCLCKLENTHVIQLEETGASNAGVAGSSPAVGAKYE